MKNRTRVFHSKKETDTIKFAKVFASGLKPGDVVGLCGDLGAGKTRFIKGAASFFGIKGTEVISPTFTLLKEYSGKGINLFHFDFYRLEDEKELEKIGFREHYLSQEDAIIFVEWADRFGRLSRYFTKNVTILHEGKNSRKITIEG
jgi:tRNA threonylcarbamoyladenosine biosynthesis protein TsaE